MANAEQLHTLQGLAVARALALTRRADFSHAPKGFGGTPTDLGFTLLAGSVQGDANVRGQTILREHRDEIERFCRALLAGSKAAARKRGGAQRDYDLALRFAVDAAGLLREARLAAVLA